MEEVTIKARRRGNVSVVIDVYIDVGTSSRAIDIIQIQIHQTILRIIFGNVALNFRYSMHSVKSLLIGNVLVAVYSVVC